MEPKKQKINVKRALLIEDDKPCQKIITHFLKKLNYKVDLVDEGQKGLKMAQEKLYDLIISDVRNNGLSGERVIPLIRESINEDTVIIVCSAFVNKKNEDLYLSWGADAALTKVCTIEDLKITIDECFKRRRNEREYLHKRVIISKKWEIIGGSLNFLEEIFHLSDVQLALLKDAVQIYSEYKLLRKTGMTESSNF